MEEINTGKTISSARKKAKGKIREVTTHLRTPLYQNGYALAFSAGLTSALGLLFWVAVARLYPTDTVGINSALLSTMLLLSGIAQLSLNSVLVRFIPVAGRSVPRLIAYAYLTSLLATAAVVLLFSFGTRWWAPSMSFLIQDPLLLVSFTAASMIWSIFSLQDSVLTGFRKAVWVPFENAFFSIAKIGLLVLFASIFGHYGIFAAWMVPVVFLVIPINILIFARLLPKYLSEQPPEGAEGSIALRWIAKYTFGNYMGTLFTLISTTLLPLLVFEQLGADQNAYFYLPWTISTSLQLLGQNMTTSLVVEAARETEKVTEYGRRILVHSNRLLAPVVVVLLLGAPLILQIFGGSYSTEGSGLLRLLSLAVIPNLVIVVYIGIARVQNNIRGIILIQGLLAAFVLGSSLLLIGRLGIVGVGWGWLVSQIVVAVLLLPFILRIRGEKKEQ